MCQHKKFEEIERALNHGKIKTIKNLKIKYQEIEIKQHSQVTYLGSVTFPSA